MCYGDDARPPLPPVTGAAADQGPLELTSADGTRFAAYFARASSPSGAGMLILPDVRGLHEFYKELAQRFAEAGIDAVAIDYFGRTTEDQERGEGFEYRPHVDKTAPATIDGAIGFYGIPARVREYVPRMKAPLLLLVAGADFTPQEEFQKFDHELSEAGVAHDLHIYEGAPHSFFDRSFEEHRQACDDAWRRLLDFVKKHTA